MSKDCFGIPCTISDINKQAETIKNWIRHPVKGKIITFINTHVYNYNFISCDVRAALEHADIISVDGTGIKILLFIKYGKWYPRTIMTHLFEKVLYDHSQTKTKAILIGTSPEEVSYARDAINKVSGSISIKEAYHGFHNDDFYIERVKESEEIPLVLIGMGAPRSEELMMKLDQKVSQKILWHIGGGTIRCYAKTKRRAPEWVSKIGMEWLHRVIFEKVLFKRYILGIPFFIFIALFHKCLKRVNIKGK